MPSPSTRKLFTLIRGIDIAIKGYIISARQCGETGKHTVLKKQRLRVCGFKSHHWHQVSYGNVMEQ